MKMLVFSADSSRFSST